MKEKLEQLYGKKVRIIKRNNKEIIGIFNIIGRKYDNDHNEDSIYIEINQKYRETYYEEVLESEIKEIEEITE